MVTECKHVISCSTYFWAHFTLVQRCGYFAISTLIFLVLQAEEHLNHGHLEQAKSHPSWTIPSALHFCNSPLLLLVGREVFSHNSEYPHFSTDLIDRFLLMQSKTKARVQVLHSSFLGGKAEQLCNSFTSEYFSCFTQFNPCRILLWCTPWVHSCEPANSCEVLSGTYFSWLQINPGSRISL